SHALADSEKTPDPIAEVLMQGIEESGVIQRQYLSDRIPFASPDQREIPLSIGKQGHWPCRREALVGDMIVRQFGADLGHQCIMTVFPSLAMQAGDFPQRSAAVCQHRQLAIQRLTNSLKFES